MLIFSRFISTLLADSFASSGLVLVDKRLQYLFKQVENTIQLNHSYHLVVSQVPPLASRWVDLLKSISELDLAHLGLISALLHRFKTTETTFYEQVKVKIFFISLNEETKLLPSLDYRYRFLHKAHSRYTNKTL